jgi:amino-acid N-acetyltransferase
MSQIDIAIQPATAADLTAVLSLLQQNGLPPDGLDGHVGSLLVARQAGAIVGSAALELYGPNALLRSVAVAGAWRGRGLGRRLTEAALALAQVHGVRRVFLLTETAADFFPRFGFRPVARTAVPAAVQQSVEFSSACPASALVMVKELPRTPAETTFPSISIGSYEK